MAYGFVVTCLGCSRVLYTHCFSAEGNGPLKGYTFEVFARAMIDDYNVARWMQQSIEVVPFPDLLLTDVAPVPPAFLAREPCTVSPSDTPPAVQPAEPETPPSQPSEERFSQAPAMPVPSAEGSAAHSSLCTSCSRLRTETGSACSATSYPLDGIVSMSVGWHPWETYSALPRRPLCIVWRATCDRLYGLICYSETENTTLAYSNLVFVIASLLDLESGERGEPTSTRNGADVVVPEATLDDSRRRLGPSKATQPVAPASPGDQMASTVFCSTLTALLELLVPGGILQCWSVTQGKYLRDNVAQMLRTRL